MKALITISYIIVMQIFTKHATVYYTHYTHVIAIKFDQKSVLDNYYFKFNNM